MFEQIFGLAFFSLFAIANAVYILKLKNPRQIFLSAAIISAPWLGGVWINFVKLDIRLSYFFLIFAFALSFNKSSRVKIKDKITFSIIVPTCLLILWIIVSSTKAQDLGASLGGVVTFIFNFVYFFTILKNVRKSDDFDYLIQSLFLALFYTSVLALLQYKFRFFRIGFIDREYFVAEQYRRGGSFYRTKSTFQHSNQYGMYQIFILPIVFREIIIMFQRKNKRLLWLYSTLFFISLLTLYTTKSRGSWIGFAAGMIVIIGIDLFQRSAKRTRKIMLRFVFNFSIIILILSIRYGPRVYDRFFGGKINVYTQAENRSKLNEIAYRLIETYPYTGVGFGNFNFYTYLIFSHNVYLLVASELGYPGLIFFIWLILGFIKEALMGVRSKNFFVSNMKRGMTSTLFGFLIASVPGPGFWISPQVSGNLWIVVGLMVSLNRLYRKSLMLQALQRKKKQFYEIKEESISN